MMTEDQKRDKILLLVDKAVKLTNNDMLEWVRHDDGYITNFEMLHKMEFSYNYENDDDEIPGNFLLFFINSEGIKYDGFYVLSPDYPGYQNFLALYHAIREYEEREFLKRHKVFMAKLEKELPV